MNNAVFGKTIVENVRKLRNIRLVTTERRRNKTKPAPKPEPNYHTTNFFTENLLPIEMRKT